MEVQIRLTAEQRETMWREGIGETMLRERVAKNPVCQIWDESNQNAIKIELRPGGELGIEIFGEYDEYGSIVIPVNRVQFIERFLASTNPHT